MSRNNKAKKGLKKTESEKKHEKTIKTLPEYQEPKYLKYIFIALCVVTFVALPLMSLDSGISGDEFVNYEHAEKVYNYYANGDTSCLYGMKMNGVDRTYLEYYGQAFDNITYFVNHWFHSDNPYETRHFLNAITGSLVILIVGLFLVKSCGYRAGILGLLMLFLSPRFLGHSFNNPKDVPFALGYVLTIYQIMLLVKELPKTSLKRLLFIAIGIAIANSVRIGGLILIPYLFLFVGCWYFFSNPEKKSWRNSEYWKKAMILAGKLALVSILGYFLSLILWPYALKDPIHHPLDSLKMMESFATNLRQIFEGGNIMSADAPWYYLPKYMLMSIPCIVLIGLTAFILLIRKLWNSMNPQVLFIVFFTFFFPTFYIIYKNSNVYGGWRHVLFTYPMIVVAAGMGLEGIFRMIKARNTRIVAYIISAILLTLPLVHIIKNHPHEYVYYNEFAGGIPKNYGYYEMDYYQHSTRAATLWLDNYLKSSGKTSKDHKIIIASNDANAMAYYLRKDTGVLYQSRYIRYYERGNKDWDYAISINSYINASQLRKAYWPPKGTIHTIEVDGKPIAAIIKRLDKSDYEAHLLVEKLNKTDETPENKMIYLKEAVAKYRHALQTDPNNETAILGIIGLYQSMGKIDSALYFTERLVEVCPSDNFLGYASNIYLQAAQNIPQNRQLYLNRVFALKRQAIESNPRAADAYYDLAILYAQIGNIHEGHMIMEKCLKKNKRAFSANYYSAIYDAQTGNSQSAIEKLEQCGKKFPAQKHECNNVIEQILTQSGRHR